MKHPEAISIRTGTDDFAKLLLEGGVFVDKSLMVRDFLQDSGDVVLVTRPRRWGKSLNLNMVEHFLAIEVDAWGNPLSPEQCLHGKLFAGGEVDLITGERRRLKPLKIASYTQLMEGYQGRFPVISLGFKDVKGSSYEEIEAGAKAQITNLYTKHRYLKQYIQPQESLLEDTQKEKLQHYFKGTLSQEDLKDSLRFLSELWQTCLCFDR